jgi:hypothetical protein
MKRALLIVAVATLSVVVSMSARVAWAIPVLQIYIEGATYNDDTDSWELTTDGTDPLRVWVIGNVGAVGTIEDVRFAASFDEGADFSISLTPSTTFIDDDYYNGVEDDSTPQVPTLNLTPDTSEGLGFDTSGTGVVDNYSTPVLGNGDPLPSHGVFGEGRLWSEWSLGNFTETDSPIGDFNGVDPFPLSFPSTGQINVYEISITLNSGDSVTIHYDAYNHFFGEKDGKVHYRKAPFSHDGDGGANGVIPEPATLAIWSVLGMVGAGGYWRSRRKRSARSSAA